MATEIAQAYVALTTKMPNAAKDIGDALDGGTKAAEESGKSAGTGWSSGFKAAAIGAAAIAGTVAAFKGLYDIGEIFDEVTDTIRAGTGAQGDALDELVESAKNVGLQVPAEFEKIGPTISDLSTRLGLTGETLEMVASQYLEAGRVLGEEVDIGQTTAAFNAFRVESDAVSGAMDILFQVSQATGVGINDLAAGAQSAAPALQNLGFTFEDSVALLGSLDKAGLNSQQVMASLSKGLVTLAKDGEEPQAAFQRVTAELQGFVDTGDTAAALDLASQIFGTRGATQFVGALQSGVLNMEDLMAATGATGDTILGVGEETMDFAERWQVTMNTAMVAIEPLASAVFAAVGDGLASVLPLLQDMGAWVSENTWAIGAIAAAIGVTLVAAFIAWTASIWAATAALLANPITWIILAIVALIAAIVLLVMNWETVTAAIGTAATWLYETIIEPVFSAIGAIFTWLYENIILPVVTGIMIYIGLWAAVITWLYETVIAPVFEAIGAVFAWIYENAIVPIVDAVIAYFQVWGAVFTWLYENVVKPVFDLVAAAFTWIYESIIRPTVDFINATVETVGSTIESVFGGIAGFIGAAFQAVLGVVRAPLNALIALINSVIGGLNSIRVNIPDWVPIVGGQTFGLSIPTIPSLAAGGIIQGSSSGTLALIGEAGRGHDEAVLPLPPGWKQEGISGGRDEEIIRLLKDIRDRPMPAVVGEKQLVTALYENRRANL